MTDWLRVSREAATAVTRSLAELPTRSEREAVLGRGAGGDETVAVDAAAERAVMRRLEALHETGVAFTLVSEELGEREFGSEAGAVRVVLDPIDGSVNAKCGIPFFCLSIAVADGPTMADVFFGYVRDFGSGEEWTARRGEGAWLDGRPLPVPAPKEEIELLAFEASEPDLIAASATAAVGLAARLRVPGSLALSLCHLAAGRIDAVCSLGPARSVDIAAAQLLVRERGLVIDLPDDPASFEDSLLDLERRSRVIAARTRPRCSDLHAALASLSADRAETP